VADTPPNRPSTSRLPDWWRTKPDLTAPDVATAEPGTGTGTAAGAGPDWWDELYADADAAGKEPAVGTAAADAEPDEGSGSTWWTVQPDYYPRPHPPAWLTQAPARVPLSPKTRSALYNASAAGSGWALGLYDLFANAIADCGQQSISGALVLGAGGCLLIAHVWDRRTRHWWPGLAWAARIPLATAITALALWAPAA
jgi:hypothetical protein